MFGRFVTLVLVFALGTFFGWLVVPGLVAGTDYALTRGPDAQRQASLEERLNQMQETLEAMTARVGEGVQNAGDRLGEAVQDANVDERAERAGEAVGDAGNALQEQLRDLVESIDQRLSNLEDSVTSDDAGDAQTEATTDPAEPQPNQN